MFPTSPFNFVYGSNWAFDSSTLISVCSDFDGVPTADCIVQNLKISNKIPTEPFQMPFSNIGNESALENSILFF